MPSASFVVVFLCFFTIHAASNRRRADRESAHETLRLCPRNLENIDGGYRRCLRPCVTDADCKGRKKKCLCDGDCGMTCIKQRTAATVSVDSDMNGEPLGQGLCLNRRRSNIFQPHTKCAPLIDPVNGKVHTTGIEAFGAKVFYTCHHDFRLKGPRSRSCQGDATWSGDAPICQPDVKCEDPPEVPHAQHNADYRYHTYELDTMIQYTCESGYAIEGFARAKCIYFNGTAKWFGPDLRCVPRDCGHPSDIGNGYREGDLFFYPHRVKFHCYPGYNLLGKQIRHCQRNGKWDGENPICKAVECMRPPDPYNGFAIITSLKYEAAVTYTCKSGYQLVRGGERRCLANQTWSGPDPKCEVVNCGPPAPIINGGYNGTSTTFNSVIFYYCNKGMKFGGTANSAKCQADANWSHPAPNCYAPCIIPHVEHGGTSTSPGDYISHGDMLNVSCVPKYELAYSTISPKCFNGTFLYIPTCQPASCKTPPVNPRRGLVIAPKTDHGMKARFACNKGYRIVGPDTVVCEYGNWSGETPSCQEVYCPWPGKLGNGTIYLVGAMGSYEYYSYIKTVVQDRQIRYECAKGFFLHGGPSGATCVDGNWSPVDMPKCYPGLHPPQSLFGPRVKRDVLLSTSQAPCSGLTSDRFEQSNVLRDPDDANHYIATVKCRAGYVANVQNNTATCRDGVWKPRKPECVPLTCRVPETMNGFFQQGNQTIPAWSELPDSSTLSFVCITGYQISGPDKLLCSTGQFFPPVIPDCIPASCHLTDINHGSYNGGYRSGLQVSHNSIIGYHCAEGFRKSPNAAVRCELGKLMPKLPECLNIQQINNAYIEFVPEEKYCSTPANKEALGVAEGNFYPNGTELEIPCRTDVGFPADVNETAGDDQFTRLICIDGEWKEEINPCKERALEIPTEESAKSTTGSPNTNCTAPENPPILVVYFGDNKINLTHFKEFADRSELTFHCEHIGTFRLNGPPKVSCLSGVWSAEFPRCDSLTGIRDPFELMNAPPPILYHKTAGIVGVGKNGELIVYPSTDLQLDCLWKRIDGTPSWMISHQFRMYPKGWASGPEDDRDYQFRLSIYHAVKDDSGVFTCMTPRGKSHSIVIKVQVVECPLIIPFVANLQANTSSTRMGTHVAYSCSRGYRLEGPSHLECQSTGLWSDRMPTCAAVVCPVIETSDAKLRIYSSSRDVHSLAEFTCSPGYRLVGSGTTKCTENGTWSTVFPSCEEILCLDPKVPDHGAVVKEGQRHVVGDTVEYSCNFGYALRGSSTAVCTESGRWSAEPECRPSCNYPGHPANGRVTAPWSLKFHYDIGEQIGFECGNGFVLVGARNMTCLQGGRWSSELPLCA